MFGNTGKELSAIGFGSNRFPAEDLNDEAGLERCADLVVRAAELGVNYFDIAHNYAKSQCEDIFRRALKRIQKPVYISSKTSGTADSDADAVLRRVYSALEHMQVEKLDFLYQWSIMSWEQYEDVMRKGGPYEGAVRARDEGLVDHLIFSSHAAVQETERIFSEGAYEGGLISYSLLNYASMQGILDTAERCRQGVLIMNPLAGGVIPQNPNYFMKNYNIKEDVTDFSLKFIYAHTPVTCILSGISKEEELIKNINVMEQYKPETFDYIGHVNSEVKRAGNICTGCGYCRSGCPQGINIPAYMQAYNMKFMSDTKEMYRQTESELVSDILVLKKLNLEYQELPESAINPCIGCGKCENICTQQLPVISRIQDVFEKILKRGSSREGHKERLMELLNTPSYKKVAIYTGGGYTAYVLSEYKRYFGEPKFKLLVADSNKQKWETEVNGYTIISPEEMYREKPDCVLITNYIYGKEIYKELTEKYPDLNVQMLHTYSDVPWVY